jgi:hypothetical protein
MIESPRGFCPTRVRGISRVQRGDERLPGGSTRRPLPLWGPILAESFGPLRGNPMATLISCYPPPATTARFVVIFPILSFGPQGYGGQNPGRLFLSCSLYRSTARLRTAGVARQPAHLSRLSAGLS